MSLFVSENAENCTENDIDAIKVIPAQSTLGALKEEIKNILENSTKSQAEIEYDMYKTTPIYNAIQETRLNLISKTLEEKSAEK